MVHRTIASATAAAAAHDSFGDNLWARLLLNVLASQYRAQAGGTDDAGG
jgi:hypothetical protein